MKFLTGINLPKTKALLVVCIVIDPISGGNITDGAEPSLSSDAHGVTLVGQVLCCINSAMSKILGKDTAFCHAHYCCQFE